MPAEWRELAGGQRRGSAPAKLLEALPGHPVFSADEIDDLGMRIAARARGGE